VNIVVTVLWDAIMSVVPLLQQSPTIIMEPQVKCYCDLMAAACTGSLLTACSMRGMDDGGSNIVCIKTVVHVLTSLHHFHSTMPLLTRNSIHATLFHVPESNFVVSNLSAIVWHKYSVKHNVFAWLTAGNTEQYAVYNHV